MMIPKPTVLTLALCLACAAGCGEDAASPAGSVATIDAAAQTLFSEIARDLCDYARKCAYAEPELSLALLRAPTPSSCEQYFKNHLQATFERARTIEARGLATFQSERAQRCLEAVRQSAGACDNVLAIYRLGFNADCQQLLTSDRGAGSACRFGSECAAGMTCKENAQGCPETCEVPGNPCDACEATEYCDEGIFLDECAPQKMLGSACGADDECSGLAGCRSADGGAKTCQPLGSVALRGACTDTSWCAPGLRCNDEGVCAQPLYDTLLKRGEVCRVSFDEQLCGVGLACINLQLVGGVAQGVCGTPFGEGEACQAWTECAISLYCDVPDGASGGTCKPLRQDGESCLDEDACLSGTCTQGICGEPDPTQSCPATP